MITHGRSEVVPVDSLRPYPGNARTHDLDLIKESLAEFGQYRSIVVQQSTRYVLAGNGLVEAARELGWLDVSVEWVDVNAATARRIVLVDNRASDLADYDDDLLAKLLAEAVAEQGSLHGTGFDGDDLAKLLREADGDDDPGLDLGEGVLAVIVDCADEQQQADLLERLQTDGYSCRPMMM